MEGNQVVQLLKKKFKLNTDKALVTKLGISPAGLNIWKNRVNVTPRQLVSLLATAMNHVEKEAVRNAEHNSVKTIVEYFPINKVQSRSGVKFELFDCSSSHLYLDGLRAELGRHHGIYVFYDSRGHAIYVGKAREQKLWKEMNLAFNRIRDVQKIMRVRHPERNQVFKTSDEKKRGIKHATVRLYDIASYFSAYQVADGMVNSVEAMLVRSFANDVLNVRMESI